MPMPEFIQKLEGGGKKEWMPIAVVGFIGIIGVMVYRHMTAGNASSVASATQSPRVPSSGLTAAGTATPADATSGILNQLSTQYDAVIKLLTNTQTTTSGKPNPFVTSGNFKALGSLQDAINAVRSGIDVYYQPSPGVYAVIPPEDIFAGSGYSMTYINIPTGSGGSVPANGSNITAPPTGATPAVPVVSPWPLRQPIAAGPTGIAPQYFSQPLTTTAQVASKN